MKTKKLGQEPAFPIELYEAINGKYEIHYGMSKRFYAACAAMQGLIANPITSLQITEQFGNISAEESYEQVCVTAFNIADELLTQENE